MPSYSDYYDADDARLGYEWLGLVLSILQRRTADGRRWVLKLPGHMAQLPRLVERFPDAHVVVCHRDPLEMLSSLTSLLATMQYGHADGIDYHAIARRQADYYAEVLQRLVGFCRAGVVDGSRIHHVRFGDLNADASATVRGVYEHFGWDFGPAIETAVAEHLAAKPRGRLGGHTHHWSDLGLDLATERARFAEYQSAFGIDPEDIA